MCCVCAQVSQASNGCHSRHLSDEWPECWLIIIKSKNCLNWPNLRATKSITFLRYYLKYLMAFVLRAKKSTIYVWIYRVLKRRTTFATPFNCSSLRVFQCSNVLLLTPNINSKGHYQWTRVPFPMRSSSFHSLFSSLFHWFCSTLDTKGTDR